MNLTSMIGGQCWFSVDSKSFDLSVEEVDGRLKGVVVEQGKGFSTCIRFKELSLRYSLEGVGFFCRDKELRRWSKVWEERGRKFKLERHSNGEGRFLTSSFALLFRQRLRDSLRSFQKGGAPLEVGAFQWRNFLH